MEAAWTQPGAQPEGTAGGKEGIHSARNVLPSGICAEAGTS